MRRLRLGMAMGKVALSVLCTALLPVLMIVSSLLPGRYPDLTRAAVSAQELGIDPTRSYATRNGRRRNRGDGIEAVSIVTPNHVHANAAIAFLEAYSRHLRQTPDSIL